MVHLGLITNFRRFLLEAERKLSECRRGEVDLEDAKPMFEMMAGGIGDVNEGYLAHLCTMSCAITYCVRLLGTTVFEGFSWAGGEILDIPLTRTDVSIVYNKQGFPRLISVVIKVQRSVQADLTRVSEDNLAQLFYEGHLVFKRQRVTPLLVLTDCGVWHFFEMDLSTSPPTVVKYYCADCGILKGTAAVDTASCLSMTPTSYFDAAPVFTEIIAFNEECKLYSPLSC